MSDSIVEVVPKMVLFTAPSGAGKTTIVRHLLKEFDQLAFSVSVTTRAKRDHEVHGKDYYFITPDEFKELRSNKELAEWEEVYEDQFYGTLKSEINRIAGNNKVVIFDIDVKGAKRLKDLYCEDCFSIFVKPPSFEILVERLKNRNTEDAASLEKRIKRMKREMTYEPFFDYRLVNDDLDVCLNEIDGIMSEYLKDGTIPI